MLRSMYSSACEALGGSIWYTNGNVSLGQLGGPLFLLAAKQFWRLDKGLFVHY